MKAPLCIIEAQLKRHLREDPSPLANTHGLMCHSQTYLFSRQTYYTPPSLGAVY